MKKEKISDYTLRISQSNRSQLVVVVFDMTMEYLEEAIDVYDKGDLEQFVQITKKARACLYELMTSLDTKYKIAVELMQIYIYINKLLIQSVIKKKPQDFPAIKRMLNMLKEAFEEIAKQDSSKALMGNTQQVYAGLTYGKGTLSESFSSQDFNRGFCV